MTGYCVRNATEEVHLVFVSPLLKKEGGYVFPFGNTEIIECAPCLMLHVAYVPLIMKEVILEYK